MIPEKHFFWTERVNLEEDIDDNVLLRLLRTLMDKLTQYNSNWEKRLENLNESRMSVPIDDQYDDVDGNDMGNILGGDYKRRGLDMNENGDGQINGQDDSSDSDGGSKGQSFDYSQNNGYRSSIVGRYSMRQTEMRGKRR